MNNQELIKLKNWFLQIKRDLPWRKNITSYKVWISEIMLQQTRVSTVIPYFLRWMEVFPNIEILALSPLEKIIKLWEGLGYYSRARAIYKTAQILVSTYNGVFPTILTELEKLPGIGAYTSRALLCFSSNMPVAPVDGNVVRVLSRFYSVSLDIATTLGKRQIQLLADRLVLADNNPHVIGEALIELGALICQKVPFCNKCPIQAGCSSFRKNTVAQFPVKKSRTSISRLDRTIFIITDNKTVLLRKETGKKIMSDLWQFPYIEKIIQEKEIREIIAKKFGMHVTSIQPFTRELQTFTRYRVSLYPVRCIIQKKQSVSLYTWVSLKNIQELSFCAGHRRILHKILLREPDKN